jgi:hypothetical protein
MQIKNNAGYYPAYIKCDRLKDNRILAIGHPQPL